MENINELIVGFCGGTVSATIILIFLNIIINKTIEKVLILFLKRT